MEKMVNGTRVVIKDKIPAKANWDLMSKLQAIGSDIGAASFDDMALIIGRMVETWDFAGKPQDPEAVGELDLFRELMPLVQAATEAITGGEDSKN